MPCYPPPPPVPGPGHPPTPPPAALPKVSPGCAPGLGSVSLVKSRVRGSPWFSPPQPPLAPCTPGGLQVCRSLPRGPNPAIQCCPQAQGYRAPRSPAGVRASTPGPLQATPELRGLWQTVPGPGSVTPCVVAQVGSSSLLLEPLHGSALLLTDRHTLHPARCLPCDSHNALGRGGIPHPVLPPRSLEPQGLSHEWQVPRLYLGRVCVLSPKGRHSTVGAKQLHQMLLISPSRCLCLSKAKSRAG